MQRRRNLTPHLFGNEWSRIGYEFGGHELENFLEVKSQQY